MAQCGGSSTHQKEVMGKEKKTRCSTELKDDDQEATITTGCNWLTLLPIKQIHSNLK